MRELTFLAAICFLIGAGCLGSLGWALFGSEDVGVERIFLLHVWLILGLLFLGMSYWIARQGPLRELGKKRAKAKAPTAKPATAQQPKAAQEEAGKPAS